MAPLLQRLKVRPFLITLLMAPFHGYQFNGEIL
jgi:hypothetical protein